MKRLNVKLLIWMIVISAVLLGAIVGLHEFQVSRNSREYLKLAEQAEAEKEFDDAVRFYEQFLQYHPNEPKVQSKFALMLVDLAESPQASGPLQIRALTALKTALLQDEQNSEVRGRLAKFLIRGQRIDDAVAELEVLRKSDPQNAEWDKSLAECRLRIGKHTEAIELLQSALAKNPKDVRAHGQLAAILLRYNDDKEGAAKALDEMVTANPDSSLAHLVRFEFRMTDGKKELAAEDLARALELGPDELDVRLTAAKASIDTKDFAKAREHLEHAASKHPKDSRTYLNLAALSRTEGKPDEAIAQLERGLKEIPESAELWEAMFQSRLASRDLDNAHKAIDQLAKLQVRSEFLDQFRAQVMMQEGKFAQALRLLNTLRPKVVAYAQLLIPVDMLRAECYGALSQTDLQIEAYRQVLFSNPAYPPARRGLGEALWRSGQVAEAQEELTALTAGGDGLAALSLLQVSIQQQLRFPPEQRNWAYCDELLKQLGEQIPDKLQMTALKIDYLARKGDFAGARELLQPLLQENPKKLPLWIARIDLEAEEKGTAAAQEELKAAQAAMGESVELKQAEVGLLVREESEESKKKLEEMLANLDQLPEADREVLRGSLANAFSLLGDRQRAYQLLQAIAKARPNDVNIRLSLFRMAREMGDDKLMQDSLVQVRELMGENSFYQYGEAARIVSAVARGDRPVADLKAARKLLDGPLAQRPNWGALYSLLGEIEQREGNIDEAIVRFQRAFDLGEQNPMTVRSLVALMVIRNRVADAEGVVARIPRAREMLGPRVMAMLDMMLGKQKEAVESAAEALKMAPDDYSTQLWYANLMARQGRFPDAEKAFLEARKLADNVPDVHLALVNHYAVTQNIDAAKKAIEEAEPKLPADQKERTLATAYELIKDYKKAEPLYEEALKKTPDDLNLLRQIAQFQGKINNPQKVVDRLNDILTKSQAAGPVAEPVARWARRTLTQMVASGGDFTALRQAVQLLDQAVPQFKHDMDDQSLKADMLSQLRDGTSRDEAIKLLNDNVAKDPNRIGDQTALARLFNRAGDWTSAKGTMLSVRKARPQDGNAMLVFAEMLLQHNELGEATEQLDAYEKEITPKAPSYYRLRSQLLAREDKSEQSITVAKSLITPPLAPDQIPQLKSVAAMLEGFAKTASNPEPYYEAAGQLYREYVKEVPDDALVLAMFVGLHESIDESLKICDDAITKGTDRETVIRTGLTVARDRVQDLTEAQKEQIKGWIEAGIKEKPDEPNMPILMADFYDLQGKLDESQKVYQNLIANKKLEGILRATVLNNLAYLLAVKDNNGKAAMPLIEEAITLVGPLSELLDTRGMVQLSLGDPKKGVEDLKRSVGDGPSSVKLFHLAVGLLKAEDEPGAAEAFKQAVQMGLKSSDVSSIERKSYDELVAKFPTEANSTK